MFAIKVLVSIGLRTWELGG